VFKARRILGPFLFMAGRAVPVLAAVGQETRQTVALPFTVEMAALAAAAADVTVQARLQARFLRVQEGSALLLAAGIAGLRLER
jgi:hypothetical protein